MPAYDARDPPVPADTGRVKAYALYNTSSTPIAGRIFAGSFQASNSAPIGAPATPPMMKEPACSNSTMP